MKTIEERIIKDVNNFYCVQIRFLPLEDWDTVNDGWRTVYITEFYENALKRIGNK